MIAPMSIVVERERAPLARDIVDGPVAATAPVLPLVAVALALPPPVTLTAVASPLRPDLPPTAWGASAAGSRTRPRPATAVVGPSRLTEMDTAQKQDEGRPSTSTTAERTTDST